MVAVGFSSRWEEAQSCVASAMFEGEPRPSPHQAVERKDAKSETLNPVAFDTFVLSVGFMSG
jgi:hypothetical protein